MTKKTVLMVFIAVVLVITGSLAFTQLYSPTRDLPHPYRPISPEPIEVVDDSEDSVQSMGYNWIENNAATYIYDGSDLQLVSYQELIPGQKYELVYEFTSRAGGYGDRSDEMSIQVITPHEIVVMIDSGQVVSAITDGVYDEITSKYINGANDLEPAENSLIDNLPTDEESLVE